MTLALGKYHMWLHRHIFSKPKQGNKQAKSEVKLNQEIRLTLSQHFLRDKILHKISTKAVLLFPDSKLT